MQDLPSRARSILEQRKSRRGMDRPVLPLQYRVGIIGRPHFPDSGKVPAQAGLTRRRQEARRLSQIKPHKTPGFVFSWFPPWDPRRTTMTWWSWWFLIANTGSLLITPVSIAAGGKVLLRLYGSVPVFSTIVVIVVDCGAQRGYA